MKNPFKTAAKVIKYIFSYSKKTPKSFYPEKERKSSARIMLENVMYLIKHGNVMVDYYSYGFDVKGVNKDAYFESEEFVSRRNRTNGIYSKKLDYTCLVGNKELFELICKTHHLRTVYSLGTYCGGGYYIDDEDQSKKPLRSLLTRYPHLFLKPSAAAKGKAAYAIDVDSSNYIVNGVSKDYDGVVEELDSVGKEMLIQEKLIQNSVLNTIYPLSLNTIRVVSVLSGEDVIIVGALLRCGADGRVVDNASQGGVFVGIDENGLLNKWGFYYPEFGTKTDKHPDTHVVFDSIEIPYYREVIALVKEAHRVFKWIPTVGWDVAVLENGPILIEGNSRYAERIMQICGGGIKEKLDNYLKK